MSAQQPILDFRLPVQPMESPLSFDGGTYDAKRDGDRLNAQLACVKKWLGDNEWHTLAALSQATGYPEASISARIRDLRKQKFGGYLVARRYVADGVWEYCMTEAR